MGNCGRGSNDRRVDDMPQAEHMQRASSSHYDDDGAVGPCRVPSRKITVEEVRAQRMEAIISLRSSATECTTGLAMGDNIHRSRSSNGKLTMTARMSRVGTAAMSTMVGNVQQASEEGDPGGTDLSSRLKSFGMRQRVMEGDGNCQFRSFAFNLFGAEKYHAVARKAAVEHLKRHEDFFGVYFEDKKEFNKYLREMRRDRTWGDELTLRAVVEAYGCEGHVITSEPANWYLVYQPDSDVKADPKFALAPKGAQRPAFGKKVFLAYVSPIHYNSIVALADPIVAMGH